MDEPVSKSQKKRDADFLQKTGVKFIELSFAKLDLLPLPDNLYKAIADAKSIKSHGAKRRQAQLIGKLMRAAEYEEILAAYERIIDEESSVTASFHEVELWRERLINEGKDALTEFIEAYHPEEVQQLRQLIKKAVDDQQKEKNTGAAKALFRYLRSCII
jgi:ribosome-associated protein